MRLIKNTLLVGLLIVLAGCEPFYNPVWNNDVPPSPGNAWEGETIKVFKTAENPYDEYDFSQTMPLSLLLDMALFNNPQTRVSWNAARANAFAYHASFSPYYPTIDYTGTISVQQNRGSSFANSGQGIITTGSTTSGQTNSQTIDWSNNFSLNYLLFDFGGRCATTELARQTLVASNWQHNYTMQQVMLSVLTAYTSYIGNKALVAAYELDLKDAEVAVKAAQVMHNAGIATLTDVLLAQSTLEQTRTSLLQAKGAESTSLGELLIAVDLPPDTCLNVEDLPKELPIMDVKGNICTLIELAKERRPDLGIALAAIEQQKAQLCISYSNSMPTLTLEGDWNQVRFINPSKPAGYNETASLIVNYPIFQGFFYLNQQRQLRAQVEEAFANLDVQIAAVSTQVVTNYYAYTSAEAALPSSEAAVEYSTRAFRGYVVQYKTGTSSVLDMLTALTSLSNARAQEVVIRTQWATSLANLAFSVGILEDDGGTWMKHPPKQLYQLPIKDDKELKNE